MAQQFGVNMVKRSDPTPERPVVGGYVSRSREAPKSFTDPLWVIVPGYSTAAPYKCEWGALHGATLPAQGAQVQVAFDDNEVPRVVWWEGERTAEPKPALVSVLPGSPVDGEEVYFQNTTLAAEGVVWNLRYRAASSSEHKWEFVGGPTWAPPKQGSMEKKTEAAQELTGGPKLTVPVAGVYDVGFSIRMESTEVATRTLTAVPWVNGVYTGMTPLEDVGSSAFMGAVYGAIYTRVTLKATDILSIGLSQTGTQSAAYNFGWLSLCPVRIG